MDEPPPKLDADLCREAAEECACSNLRRAARSLTRLFDERLAPVGLRSTQLIVLLEIEVLGSAGKSRLARELGMDRSTLSRNLKPLASRGLVATCGGPGGRAVAVELTDDGRRLLAEAIPYWQEAQDEVVGRLGRDRWERVRADLAQIVDVVQEAG